MKNHFFSIGIAVLILISATITNFVLSFFEMGLSDIMQSIMYGDTTPIIVFIAVTIVLVRAWNINNATI
ncbi:hypothetical protein F6Y05_34345 [Bacillus megaterium]|nr:hypothetical protein [Priestia megaterium]